MNVSTYFIFTISALLASACTPASKTWSRPPTQSLAEPGIIVIGAQKEKLESLLKEQAIRGRIISESRKIFEIDPTNIQSVQTALPESTILQDRVFHVSSPDMPEELMMDLKPEDAARTALQQLNRIHLQQAQQISQGEGVLVAVIDSGLNVNRFDIQNNVWTNPTEIENGKDDDGNGLVDDLHGWSFARNSNDLLDAIPHGTMSAAVIASPLTGIAKKAKVLPLAVIRDDGVGTISFILEAIAYAADHGAHIINMSLGGSSLTDKEQASMLELVGPNILIVQSAGNSATHCNQMFHYKPEIQKFTLLVGATNLPPAPIKLAFYSNHGDCVDVAAPSGEGIASPNQLDRGIVAADPYSTDRFILYHGTSTAAPVVSGVAALVKSHRPQISAIELKKQLLDSSQQVPSLKGKIKNERFINALDALIKTSSKPGT